MRDALIVSTARTPLGKSYRGAFNNTTVFSKTCLDLLAKTPHTYNSSQESKNHKNVKLKMIIQLLQK